MITNSARYHPQQMKNISNKMEKVKHMEGPTQINHREIRTNFECLQMGWLM